MKKMLLSSIILIIVIKVSFAQWETVYWESNTAPLPTLNAVSFKDIATGMSVGYYDNRANVGSIVIQTEHTGTTRDTIFMTTDTTGKKENLAPGVYFIKAFAEYK